jgi:hypothetical protein
MRERIPEMPERVKMTPQPLAFLAPDGRRRALGDRRVPSRSNASVAPGYRFVVLVDSGRSRAPAGVDLVLPSLAALLLH